MSFDIYGERLRGGHCEVHPHVHEEYPCHVCLMESRQRQSDREAQEQAWREERNASYARMIGDSEIKSWFPTPTRAPEEA